MHLELHVDLRNEFGKERYYAFTDNSLAALLLKLMKRKSFTREQLKECQDFGCVIHISQKTF